MSRALWLVLPLALSSVACTYDNGDARRITDPNGSVPETKCGTQTQATIDVDGKLELSEPGEGAGIFVEYATGGHWTVTTSCDTNQSKVPCNWDVVFTAEDGTSITNVKAVDLESNDGVKQYDETSFQLQAQTTDDFDGFTFDTPPGAAVLFDTLLDDTCSAARPLFFWLGDGAVHPGAPSNPFALVPSAD